MSKLDISGATIRLADRKDLNRIVEIYNQAIEMRRTADLDRISAAEREAWFQQHSQRHPVIVYAIDNHIVGWLSISMYRPGRRALTGAVEVSYYVDYGHHGKGVGSKLMEAGLSKCRIEQFETVFAILLENNDPSIALLKKYGFELWGHLPNIAKIDDTRIGQVYYGLALI